MELEANKSSRRDIALLVYNILGILVLIGLGIYMLGAGPNLGGRTPASGTSQDIMDASSMFFCACLLLPLLFLNIRKLGGAKISNARLPGIKIWQGLVLFVIWIGVIVTASLLSNIPAIGTALAIPFFLGGVAIPVAGVIWIAAGGLPTRSWRRLWAAFSIGMTGSTLIAIILEYGLVALAALAAGAFASINPAWHGIFIQIKNEVTRSRDVESLLTALGPYLTSPFAILAALVFASGIAPVIEEALKPAAVWFLGKHLRSPAEGFAMGAVCGAGFALLEGSLAIGGMISVLGVGLAARAASSLMHITASGLMGWAITSAYQERRYGRLAGIFLVSVGIHALWNGAVILAVFGSLRLTLQPGHLDLIGPLMVLLGISTLGLLLLTIMVALPLINRRFRHDFQTTGGAKQNDIIAPPLP